MFNETAAQSDQARIGSNCAPPDLHTSDSALLESALAEALDAHSAGLLAAPFGVDDVALARARRRALISDLMRLTDSLRRSPHLESA